MNACIQPADGEHLVWCDTRTQHTFTATFYNLAGIPRKAPPEASAALGAIHSFCYTTFYSQ